MHCTCLDPDPKLPEYEGPMSRMQLALLHTFHPPGRKRRRCAEPGPSPSVQSGKAADWADFSLNGMFPDLDGICISCRLFDFASMLLHALRSAFGCRIRQTFSADMDYLLDELPARGSSTIITFPLRDVLELGYLIWTYNVLPPIQCCDKRAGTSSATNERGHTELGAASWNQT